MTRTKLLANGLALCWVTIVIVGLAGCQTIKAGPAICPDLPEPPSILSEPVQRPSYYPTTKSAS